MKYKEFSKKWDTGAKAFLIETSGSTGTPKEMILERRKLLWSAEQSLKYLPSKPNLINCCLPTNKVGGFMQIVRAKIWDVPFYKAAVSANPKLNEKVVGSSISLTPLQLYNIQNSRKSLEFLEKAHSILIGGGDIGFDIVDSIKPILFHTYGMTETYSHIAIRRMNNDYFKPLDGVDFGINEEGCLKIKCFLTNDLWMQTNDLCVLQNEGFQILGRADNVINTGGLKLHSEVLEAEIIKQNPHAYNGFFVAGIPDKVLGEKAVLVKQQGLEIDLASVQSKNLNYIKSQIEIEELVFTQTQKIDRRKSLKAAGL